MLAQLGAAHFFSLFCLPACPVVFFLLIGSVSTQGNFKKKSQHIFLIFENLILEKKSQNFWKSRKSQKYFENFPLKIVLKIENFEILKFLIFRFSIRFSMENFQKYFWDFRDFQNFWFFSRITFSKIKKLWWDFFLKVALSWNASD